METTNSIIEIFSITLRPGTGAAFHQLYLQRSVPLQKKWKVDLLSFGPSLHDKDAYLVVRRYKSLEDRQQSQQAFYGSNDWKLGPREMMLALIESSNAIVVPANPALLEGLQILDLAP